MFKKLDSTRFYSTKGKVRGERKPKHYKLVRDVITNYNLLNKNGRATASFWQNYKRAQNINFVKLMSSPDDTDFSQFIPFNTKRIGIELYNYWFKAINLKWFIKRRQNLSIYIANQETNIFQKGKKKSWFMYQWRDKRQYNGQVWYELRSFIHHHFNKTKKFKLAVYLQLLRIAKTKLKRKHFSLLKKRGLTNNKLTYSQYKQDLLGIIEKLYKRFERCIIFYYSLLLTRSKNYVDLFTGYARSKQQKKRAQHSSPFVTRVLPKFGKMANVLFWPVNNNLTPRRITPDWLDLLGAFIKSKALEARINNPFALFSPKISRLSYKRRSYNLFENNKLNFFFFKPRENYKLSRELLTKLGLKTTNFFRRRRLRKPAIFKNSNISLAVKMARSNYFLTLFNSTTGAQLKTFSAGTLIKLKTARKRRSFQTLMKIFKYIKKYLTRSRISSLNTVFFNYHTLIPEGKMKLSLFRKMFKVLKAEKFKIRRWAFCLFKPHGYLIRASALRRK